MIKTAAELLQVAALRTRIVKVRDAEVCVRELSVRARQEFTGVVRSGLSSAEWLVQMSVIGEDGQPLFSADDAAALVEGAPEVMDAIVSAVMEISGLKETAKKD